MLTKTNFSVNNELLQTAISQLPSNDFRHALNKPTGNFFYDPWVIKDEFKNTVWETLLSTIPGPFGEARIIQLGHGTCYMSHCDIDDRYHLNLEGQYSFLIDIDSQTMFQTVADSCWYVIDTGCRHVAANFGSVRRTQLVVRHLLNNANLSNPVTVKIFPICENPRFEFDDIVSPWLNKMNKEHSLKDFTPHESGVTFKIDSEKLDDLKLFPTDKFKIIIEK